MGENGKKTRQPGAETMYREIEAVQEAVIVYKER
jgi:hypothetical protein